MSATELVKGFGRGLPAHSFQWRNSSLKMLYPKDMTTDHLYNVFVMIWNHTMPDDAATHDYVRYDFDNYYTMNYMKEAIFAIFPVLMARDNMTDHQLHVLGWIERYLTKLKRPDLLNDRYTRKIGRCDSST